MDDTPANSNGVSTPDNVVPLQRKADETPSHGPRDGTLIWVCACGCSTHFLHDDGHVECANCRQVFTTIEGQMASWRKVLKPVEPDARPEDRSITVTKMQSARKALEHILMRTNPDEIAVCVILHNNGRVDTWGDVGTQEQIEWLSRRFNDAHHMLLGLPLPELNLEHLPEGERCEECGAYVDPKDPSAKDPVPGDNVPGDNVPKDKDD